MTAKHVRRARSVEILVKSYLDKLSRVPATSIAKALCSVILGRSYLQQLLSNLTIWAAKYVPQVDGIVEVSQNSKSERLGAACQGSLLERHNGYGV